MPYTDSIIQNILEEVVDNYSFQTFTRVQEFLQNEAVENPTSIYDFDTVSDRLRYYYIELLQIHPYNLISLLQESYGELNIDEILGNIIHIQRNLHQLLNIHPNVDYYEILQSVSPHYYENRIHIFQNSHTQPHDADTFCDSDFESVSETDSIS